MALGSNNPYPSVLLVEQGSAPANPASGDQRLYISTTDHKVYVVNSTGTVTAVGQSPMVKLATISGALSTFDFTSIPGSYSHLRLVGQLRISSAVTDDYLLLRFNADSATNYNEIVIANLGGTANTGTRVANTSSRIGDVAGGSAPAGSASSIVIDIPNYAGTTFNKSAIAQNYVQGAALTTSQYALNYYAYWLSTAAITEVNLIPNSGAFVAGSKVDLYGIL